MDARCFRIPTRIKDLLEGRVPRLLDIAGVLFGVVRICGCIPVAQVSPCARFINGQDDFGIELVVRMERGINQP